MLTSKKYFHILTFIFSIFFLGQAVNAQTIRIALVADHCAPQELVAIKTFLNHEKKFSYSLVHLRDLKNITANKSYTHLWYHRTDTSAFTSEEINLGNTIRSFVQKGGNVFLSMEAVPLLNNWGIESVPFQLQKDTVTDEGFGRPLGFHAFKQHPLFEGLLGGVYTSKQKQDHVVRKHGFFDNAVPQQGKVVGIQWTYITFTENSKLLLEYQLGKGKIIAAGSYLYYAAENYNRPHLEKFTENVFLYTTGCITSGRKYYWDYTPSQIAPANFSAAPIQILPVTKWNLPSPTLSQKQDTSTKDFYDLVGRKILWMGKMNNGVDEIWMHPFMALRDFSVGVKLKGTDSISWLRYIPSSTTIAPEYLVRNYRIRSTTLREVYTVSFEDPAGVAHFEVEGNDIEEIAVKYASSLRFMWPYAHTATGSITYGFNNSINSHIISGQKGELNTVVMYSSRPLQQSAVAVKELNQVVISNRFALKNNGVLNVYITGSTKNYQEAVHLLAAKQKQMSLLFEKSNQYYHSLISNHLNFQTPDTQFNKGYRWALARTDQFLQTTPGIGTALMAGFGTTARGWNGRQTISGRPGYAWYFGRDGEWSAMAIDAYGDFNMVKGQLETLMRYQDINGKIYHELTSSGVAHYDASDATPLFVILASHYLRYSGDLNFIRLHWKAIKKAIDFCYSTDTDGDGLIENTNVGHGWIEGGSLFGTHTEFYLAGCWASALEGAAYMAGHLNDRTLASHYQKDAANVRHIIDRDFWNEKQQFFNNGKMLDGSYMPDATVLATVPVYLNAVSDSMKIQKVNARLAGSRFSTDWGIRMIEDSSAKYNAGSYHAGMVWPLYGGWAALSEFRTGNNKSGFQHIMNNLLVYKHWGLGSVEETLNGDRYKPNGVCSHQCWSETMVLQPSIEGMLGLEPDALAHTIKLAPYFPWHWPYASVHNIRMGTSLLNLDMKREMGKTMFIVHSNSAVQLNFQPKFPSGTFISKVMINGRSLPFHINHNAEGISIDISTSLVKGNTEIVVEHNGGIGALPLVADPMPGDSSTGAHIIAETLNGKIYTAIVEGRPGTSYTIPVYLAQDIVRVEDARLKERKENLLILQVDLPASKEKYIQKSIRIQLK